MKSICIFHQTRAVNSTASLPSCGQWDTLQLIRNSLTALSVFTSPFKALHTKCFHSTFWHPFLFPSLISSTSLVTLWHSKQDRGGGSLCSCKSTSRHDNSWHGPILFFSRCVELTPKRTRKSKKKMANRERKNKDEGRRTWMAWTVMMMMT